VPEPARAALLAFARARAAARRALHVALGRARHDDRAARTEQPHALVVERVAVHERVDADVVRARHVPERLTVREVVVRAVVDRREHLSLAALATVTRSVAPGMRSVCPVRRRLTSRGPISFASMIAWVLTPYERAISQSVSPSPIV
jgi:hypothetical protein